MLYKKGISRQLSGDNQQSSRATITQQSNESPHQVDLQTIHITEEQVCQIQHLVSNSSFGTLRKQVQSNPQILPQLLLMLQQEHPVLHQLFTQSPELLNTLLMDTMPGVEADFEDLEEDLEQTPENLHLSDKDYQAIQNVL
jgi:hypothetical protein